MTSPLRTSFSSSNRFSEISASWSTFRKSGISSGKTPHSNASRLRVSASGENAAIGTSGRYREINRAVNPLCVNTTIHFMCSSRDAWHTSSATVSATFNFSCVAGRENSLMLASASSMIRAIMLTASTGYLPLAVSAESITASEPSKIAFATSEASARVGRGFSVMDSSICVAVITGRRNSRARAIIFFCTTGTRSGLISTPKSPRATMTPSETRKMPSRFSMASGFSSLAITGVSFPARRIKLFASSTSSGRRTKLTAM